MKIQNICYIPNNYYRPQRKENANYAAHNTFCHSYVYCRDGKEYRIKSFIFSKILKLPEAIENLLSDKKIINEFSYYKSYPRKILNSIRTDAEQNPKLKDLQIKSLIDYGKHAFVFELSDSTILKITRGDHFLGRRQESFDLPIKNIIKGRNNLNYYYFEEKCKEEELSSKEILKVIEEIKSKGYRPVDGLSIKSLRKDQFGRSSDGKIYLIDPECAESGNFIKRYYQKIKRMLLFML